MRVVLSNGGGQACSNHAPPLASSSMTSVPKPLKFLAPHYADLKGLLDSWVGAASANTLLLADLLSVLAMTMGTTPCESLHYKLRGDPTDLDSWGHEYVRGLSGEVAVDWAARTAATPPGDLAPLRALVDRIVPFQMSHNAEVEVRVGGGPVAPCRSVILLRPPSVLLSSHNCYKSGAA